MRTFGEKKHKCGPFILMRAGYACFGHYVFNPGKAYNRHL